MDDGVVTPLWLFWLAGLLSFVSILATGLLLLPSFSKPLAAAKKDESPQKKKKPGVAPAVAAPAAEPPLLGGFSFRRKLALVGVLWVLTLFTFWQMRGGRADIGFDPYTILSVPRSATPQEISKAYRELSRLYHPDRLLGLSHKEKASYETKFKLISKAHEALTKEDAMRNFELYGHPDGPRAFEFDLAMPDFFKKGNHDVLLLVIYMVLISAGFYGLALLAKSTQQAKVD